MKVTTITANAVPSLAQVSKPSGLVQLTSASSGYIVLQDGEYNGQKVIVHSLDASNNTGIVDSTGAAVKGTATITPGSGSCALFRWYHDGTNGKWYGISSVNNGS